MSARRNREGCEHLRGPIIYEGLRPAEFIQGRVMQILIMQTDFIVNSNIKILRTEMYGEHFHMPDSMLRTLYKGCESYNLR